MRFQILALAMLAACNGKRAAPSKESYRPAWCPRTASKNPPPCIRMDTKEACEQDHEGAVECVPLNVFACYEPFSGDREYCFPTLADCERDRGRVGAALLKQRRNQLGACTLYRTKR